MSYAVFRRLRDAFSIDGVLQRRRAARGWRVYGQKWQATDLADPLRTIAPLPPNEECAWSLERCTCGLCLREPFMSRSPWI
jgi:hypothetical protein